MKKNWENAFCKNKVAKNRERKETKFDCTDYRHTDQYKDILIMFTTMYWEMFRKKLKWKSGAWGSVLGQISKIQSAHGQFIILQMHWIC